MFNKCALTNTGGVKVLAARDCCTGYNLENLVNTLRRGRFVISRSTDEVYQTEMPRQSIEVRALVFHKDNAK